jgi:hypothetical protein
MKTVSMPGGLVAGIALLCLSAASPGAEPVPLVHVHAHNDYEHKRPLLDALDHGFCSVEADIYLVDGQLLVAHDRSKVKPERTLQALYLDPLRERVKKNGGRVYPGGPECVLLIDLKNRWQTIYPVLRDTLTNYSDMLTTFGPGGTKTNAVRVIITGYRSKDMFAGESVRYACVDGELADLDNGPPADLVPWISGNWRQSFSWGGTGPMPEPEKRRLQSIVSKAHAQGRQVRFWGAPDQSVFWREMRADGVDLINTDDLEGAQKFLLSE